MKVPGSCSVTSWNPEREEEQDLGPWCRAKKTARQQSRGRGSLRSGVRPSQGSEAVGRLNWYPKPWGSGE